MVKFINTPFDDVIKATENIYGEINCEVVFDYIEGEENIGVTTFPEDGTVPLIQIDVQKNNIASAVATLAHELAHVIVGIEQEHNEVFVQCCEAIEKEYNRYCEEKYHENCIKTKCYDCGAEEYVKNDMLGKKCGKCKGRLITV